MSWLSYYRGLGRNPLLVVTSQALLWFGIGSVMSILLPIYLAKAGYHGNDIGAFLTVGLLTSSVTAIPFGIIADRIGKTRIAALGALFTGLGFLGILFTLDLALLLVLALMLGVGYGMSFTSISALQADVAPPEKRNLVFSLGAAVSTLGVVIGSIISVVPAILRSRFGFGELQSYLPVLAIPALLSFIAVPLILLVHTPPSLQKRSGIIPRKSLPILKRIMAVDALIALGAGLVIPLFPYWFFLRFGLDESVLAPLFTASNFMLLISYLLAPRISDKLGTVPTVVVSQAIAITLLVVIPLVPSYPVVGVLFVFRGLLMNMVNPLVRSMILGMVHAEERATASGVLSIAWTVPNSATPSVGGYMMDNLSLSLPFYLCGVLYGAAVSLFFAFFRRTR